MAKEGEARLVAVADVFQAGLCGGVGLVDGVGAEVRRFGGFDVSRCCWERALSVFALEAVLPRSWITVRASSGVGGLIPVSAGAVLGCGGTGAGWL